MSKPRVVYPDVERDLVDWLTPALEDEGETVTVGIVVPDDWTPASTPHVLVAVDDAEVVHPILTAALARISVFTSSTTEAKRLANLAMALLLTSQVAGVRPETGPVAGRDPDSHAELATFTVRVRARTSQITPS